MKVLDLFVENYAGAPADAVWIVESATNREWFARYGDSIDPNSAVFNERSAPVDVLWNVFDHHPTWSEIEVRGRNLDAEIAAEIGSDAQLSMTDRGFCLTRP